MEERARKHRPSHFVGDFECQAKVFLFIGKSQQGDDEGLKLVIFEL